MDLLTLGPLKTRRVVKRGAPRATNEKNEDNSALTIVLCHGFGAPGDDLVGLADGIDVPAGTVMLFPEAPVDLGDSFGLSFFGAPRAWWLIDVARRQRAISREELRQLSREVPEGLAAARTALGQMLDAVAAHEPADRLVLGGFSQGAMLSLDLALREPERRLSGLVLLSGTLIAEPEWMPLTSGRRSLRVFQSHGESDPVLPFSVAEQLRDSLMNAGLDVTFDAFAGPHTITPRTTQHLSVWLRSLLVRGAKAV
jgi:phospholipase/carboxylesterase